MPKIAENVGRRTLETRLGCHAYGDGLYLLVRGPHVASWLYRYAIKVNGRSVRREMGLGPAFGAGAVSIHEARETLLPPLKRAVREGRDPVADRKAERARVEAEREAATEIVTFKQATKAFIQHRRKGWRSVKHTDQFEQTLETYAYKVFGERPVGEITKRLVYEVLAPIWETKHPTATRVRARIERVLDFCKSRDWRTGENPAVWKGGLDGLMKVLPKVEQRHHAAMAYEDVPAFWVELGQKPGLGAMALKFAILTAARTGEVVGALWSEIDLAAGLWTIPGRRMKSNREHTVPLSRAALAILSDVQPFRRADDFVWPGDYEDACLSDASMFAVLRRMNRRDVTIHGFRSSFRSWTNDEMVGERETAEAALAHRLGDRTEQAYQRGHALKKRRALMESWAEFVTTPPGANVVPMKRAG